MQHSSRQPNRRRRRRTRRSRLPLILFLLFLAAVLLFSTFYFLWPRLQRQGMEFLHPLEFEELIYRYSEEHDLDPFLVKAVIRVESSFIPDAVSPVGARGLMQIMPATAEDLAGRMGIDHHEDDLFSPAYNIRMGTFYLRLLIDYFGEQDTALAAYNAGRGNVGNWLRDPRYSSDGVTLHDIPFSETRHYVVRVNHYIEVYRDLYAE